MSDENNQQNPAPPKSPHGEDSLELIRGLESRLKLAQDAGAEQLKAVELLIDQQLEIENQRKALAEEVERFKEQSAKIEADQACNNERAAELDQQAEALNQRETALAEDKQAVEAQLDEAQKRETEAAEQKSAFEARLGEVQEKAAELQQESEAFEKARAELEEQANSAKQRAEALTKEKDELEEAREVLDADNSRLRGELAAAEAAGAGAEAANKALNELRASLGARDAQVEKLTERLKTAQAQLEEGQTSAGVANELRAQLDTRDQEIAELSKRLVDVQSQLENNDGADAEAEELRARLAAATSELDELRNAPPTSDEPVSEQVAKRDKVIESLTAQLRESEEKRAAAVAAKPAGSAPKSSQADLVRRDRLKAIRNSLRDKAGRLSQAKEMIDQRQEEMEQVLKLRSDLAAQREALKREKADVGKHNAKAGAGVAAVCAAIAILLLAPVSWKVAGMFSPADHLATASIELASRSGQPLPDNRLQAFRASIDELATDPKVVEQTATRMSRRGIEAYKQPAALATALKARLDVSHPRPGGVDIAYTDKGPLLTQRALETYIAALVSAANDRASARMDNTTVVVTDAPNATTPVNISEQAIAAGGVWAGSSLVVLLFLSFVAIAMTKARERIRGEEAMLQSARDGSGIGWGIPGQD